MFRSFGHTKSSILNGGLPRWVDEGLPIEIEVPAKPKPTDYAVPTLHSANLRSRSEHR